MTSRDTPAALAAMELAFAYIEEVRAADRPSFDDTDTRKQQLNTLSLASKKLDAAQRFDPDAIFEGQDDNENAIRFSINELKAEALLFEGITHRIYDITRAIPALTRATAADPNNARVFHVLGLTHAANMNRAEAIAAFERAVTLNPGNLAYRKELDRAQNLTAGEIAGYKATRAGEKIFDAGIKTANASIRVYNVGVFFWNIFWFTWHIVTFPARLALRLLHLFRVIG